MPRIWQLTEIPLLLSLAKRIKSALLQRAQPQNASVQFKFHFDCIKRQLKFLKGARVTFRNLILSLELSFRSDLRRDCMLILIGT